MLGCLKKILTIVLNFSFFPRGNSLHNAAASSSLILLHNIEILSNACTILQTSWYLFYPSLSRNHEPSRIIILCFQVWIAHPISTMISTAIITRLNPGEYFTWKINRKYDDLIIATLNKDHGLCYKKPSKINTCFIDACFSYGLAEWTYHKRISHQRHLNLLWPGQLPQRTFF